MPVQQNPNRTAFSLHAVRKRSVAENVGARYSFFGSSFFVSLGNHPFFRRIRLPELDFSEPRESGAGLEFKALQQYALKIPQSLGPPGCKACGSIMSRGVHGAVAGHSEPLGAGQVSPMLIQNSGRSARWQKLTQLRSFSSFRPNAFSFPEQEI